jgi:prepilin-type N-terminal cleavage/methylation domain-containing protein
MRATAHVRRGERGFSLIELLITIFLAGIIFLAMVPLFVSGLKTTSTNSRRVVATNIAQARIETIRMLGANMASPSPYSTSATTGYTAITPTNLNSNTWNPTLISTTYTPPAGGQPYNITTSVSPDPAVSPTPAYKTVTVTVTRSTDNFQTKVSTVIMNPMAVVATSTLGGAVDPNSPHSLTVAFKNWQEVSTTKGVVVVYVNTSPTPNVTTTATPAKQVPTSSSTTVTWTNLPGGMNYLYTVTCNPQSPSSWGSPLVGESFHLLSNGWMKFDTNPGGS